MSSLLIHCIEQNGYGTCIRYYLIRFEKKSLVISGLYIKCLKFLLKGFDGVKYLIFYIKMHKFFFEL